MSSQSSQPYFIDTLQLLAFETYRDLVKLLHQNLSEEQGLISAELQNIEQRASARSAAAAAVGIQAGQTAGPGASSMPAGIHTLQVLLNLLHLVSITT